MPYWSPLVVDGTPIDLSHLEPFEFFVLPTRHEIAAAVRVRFHDHCFTETYDPSRYQGFIRTNQASAHERRTFSPQRYELSKALPAIIRALDGKRIAQTREGNLVRITLQDGTTYPMFFTLRRESARQIGMFVVSAYPWNGPGRIAITGEMNSTWL